MSEPEVFSLSDEGAQLRKLAICSSCCCLDLDDEFRVYQNDEGKLVAYGHCRFDDTGVPVLGPACEFFHYREEEAA